MLWGVFLITFIALGNDATPLRLAPRPSIDLHNIDWHLVATFFVMMVLGIAFVESLNLVGWYLARDRTLPTELMQRGGDLLIPKGWAGPALAFGLLAVAYGLR
jgi:hypothetical protein